ncbi:MAG: ECF transporter S component [Acholeplasmatales bacterium]|nr:ECF transporter S component [Acholeplasmatales bacterium]
MKNQIMLKKCIITSILAALSVVLYVIGPKFSLPIFPNFLKVNFSMVPIFICLIVVGAPYALVIVLIRSLFGLITGTTSAGIGETADLIIGMITILFTQFGKFLFNNKAKDIPMFLFALLGWVVGGLLSNCFALPMYVNVMNAKEWLVFSMQKIIPAVTESNYVFYYFVAAVLPFNLILGFAVVTATYLIHFKLKDAYELFLTPDKKVKKEENNLDDYNNTEENTYKLD